MSTVHPRVLSHFSCVNAAVGLREDAWKAFWLMHGAAMPDTNGRISKVCNERKYTAPFILCISSVLNGASWLPSPQRQDTCTGGKWPQSGLGVCGKRKIRAHCVPETEKKIIRLVIVLI